MRIDEKREKKNVSLQQAPHNANTFKMILHICAKCQRIRDDNGHWKNTMAHYECRSDALFTHGLCPECMDILYGNEEWYVKRRWKQ